MTDIPPYISAYVDQHKAQLRDLVEQARQHLAFGCQVPLPCPGEDVVRALVRETCHHRLGLLAMAIAELAKYGYGAPLEGLELTDAGHAALDQDEPPTEGRPG